MGGRGSGGGKGGGGAASKAPKNVGEGITDKNELIRLYNSISGNPAYSIDQRVREMEAIVFRTLLKSVFAFLNRYDWLCV